MDCWLVDAFTDKAFAGNPAAVVELKAWPADEILLNIAKEFNQSETVFIVWHGKKVEIRWFTTEIEMDLCGHATLAASHVLFQHLGFKGQSIHFETRTAGDLFVQKQGPEIQMQLPRREGSKIELEQIDEKVLNGISKDLSPIAAYQSRDLLLVYPGLDSINSLTPDFSVLGEFPHWIIVTSQSNRYDFVSRFFCAGDGIQEDPVTGSAHCTLIPYWSKELGKQRLTAFQASSRGGELWCCDQAESVLIRGQAKTVMVGRLIF